MHFSTGRMQPTWPPTPCTCRCRCCGGSRCTRATTTCNSKWKKTSTWPHLFLKSSLLSKCFPIFFLLLNPSFQSSSRRLLSAPQRFSPLPSLLFTPSARPTQRSRAAAARPQPRPQPATREPASQPHPDECPGWSCAERWRAEPWLAGLAVYRVTCRCPAQHRLLLLVLQPLRHGDRRHVARLLVSNCHRLRSPYLKKMICTYIELITLVFRGFQHFSVCVF